jgi:hypothetical protein
MRKLWRTFWRAFGSVSAGGEPSSAQVEALRPAVDGDRHLMTR